MQYILTLIIFFSSGFSYSLESQKKLDEFLFQSSKSKINTEAFVLVKDNQVLYENFKVGSKETKQLLWSMSKSISSLIYGIAEDQGYIRKDDSIYKYFKEEINQASKDNINKLKKIKIKDLLGMASGLDWNEFYEESPFSSDVVRMLYFSTKSSMANYVLTRSPRYTPGKRFYYSSGDTNLLMASIQRALPDNLKLTYPWEFLFKPLGINGIFEKDKSGTFVGSSYLYLTTDELLKIAKFILNKGKVGDKQILSQDYLNYAFQLTEPMQGKKCLKESSLTYGAQFWLNKSCSNGEKPFKNLPDNLILLLGHGGQIVYIFPTEKIIAIRIASDYGDRINREKLGELILERAKSEI